MVTPADTSHIVELHNYFITVCSGVGLHCCIRLFESCLSRDITCKLRGLSLRVGNVADSETKSRYAKLRSGVGTRGVLGCPLVTTFNNYNG